MNRYTLTIVVISAFLFNVHAQSTWKADPANSNVQFEVSHMSISTVTGKFTSLECSMKTADDDFENAQIEASVKVADINTGNLTRDKHLKQDDFFNMEKYPTVAFKSNSFKRLNGNEYLVNGELTIRDVTKPISFTAMYSGRIDLDDKSICVFKGGFTINRFDYGLKWDDTLDTGSLVVGADVAIDLSLEFVKQ